MTDSFLDRAKGQMGAVERLLKGLPVIKGYVDKELRRDADRQLRETLASALEAEKQRLYDIQKKLLKSGGLRYMDEVDDLVQRLQTLTDRIRHASYGYAGLFDAQRIREEQLEALHRFDLALAARTHQIQQRIDQLAQAVGAGEAMDQAIADLEKLLADLHRLYDQRHQAIIDPGLLESDFLPDIPDEWLQAAQEAESGGETEQASGQSTGEGGDEDADKAEGFFSRLVPGGDDD